MATFSFFGLGFYLGAGRAWALHSPPFSGGDALWRLGPRESSAAAFLPSSPRGGRSLGGRVSRAAPRSILWCRPLVFGLGDPCGGSAWDAAVSPVDHSPVLDPRCYEEGEMLHKRTFVAGA